MLKVMLVDDEPLIIKGLKKIIHWESYGFQVVAEAQNGEEAIETAKKVCPHVIVTDVKMPGKNGLEVVRILRKIMPDTKFVILSGYDEFSYAQTAIKNGCLDYILKPVKPYEFEDILVKLQKDIEDEQRKKRESDTLKEKLEASIPALREKILSDILEGNISDEKEIEQKLNFIDVNLNTDFTAMTVELNKNAVLSGNISIEEERVMEKSAFNIINHLLSREGYGYASKKHSDKFILFIMNQDNKASNSFARQVAGEIKEAIRKILNRTVTIGISSWHKGYGEIVQCCKESEIALKYKLFVGIDRIIHFEEIQRGEKITFSYPFNIEKELFQGIQACDRAKVEVLINQLFGNINQYELISPDYIYKVCYEMLLMTSRMIGEIGGEMNEIFDSDILSMEILMEKQTIGDLRKWLKGVYTGIVDYVNELKKGSTKSIINDIKRYINEKYSNEISLNDLAGRFFMNPSYLSQLFKSETGQNLSDYITYIRVLNAKRLLLNKDLKIYEVSVMTGYPDPKYFSQVFRKITGVTPREYRGE